LIEVAFPVREVSAESVRQKSPQRGHISTLHLWWARRPLAASRALVFASLVPDPDDSRCPTEFVAATERMLKNEVPSELRYLRRGREVRRDPDPYRPYDGVPDTLRNRLLCFIAKWSPEAHAFEAGKSGKPPKPDQLLDDRSLVKWETGDSDSLQGREVLRIARDLVRVANGGEAPTALDPFAGGGAIPLEMARLGCRPIANDYSPVAYLILRGTCELPALYGKPGARVVEHEEMGRKIERRETVANVLAHDVQKWALWILERAKARIGHFYPPGADGRTVVGYVWARTVPCANTSCRAAIPMVRTLLLCDKEDKRIALTMAVDRTSKTAAFGIAKGADVRETEGTMLKGGSVRCPFHEDRQVTLVKEVRAAGLAGRLGERMAAVIVEGKDGKDYRAVEDLDLAAFAQAAALDYERPAEAILPEITTRGEDQDDLTNSTGIRVHLYGFETWGSLFNPRQLVAMQTFVSCLHEALGAMESEFPDQDYRKAVALYLGLWVSRNAMRMTTVGRWHVTEEKLEQPFDGAKLPFKCDYPEANPFSSVSGGFENQLDLMVRVLNRESAVPSPAHVLRGDAASLAVPDRSVNAVITDPPYFDEAAYADLSDFFYVWLKRGIGEVFPDILSLPQTPKTEEATVMKHRHGGSEEVADRHFSGKLAAAFSEAKRACIPDGVHSIVFAHQDTKAWTSLVRSLFAAGLSIDATWPVEMEMKNRTRGLNSAALETSITVVCRPRVMGSAAGFKEVGAEIERTVHEAVKRFWTFGFRGADLIVASYGPAVGVFGRYERVERRDGTPVDVPELLQLARRAARDAIAGEFRADNLSTLYYVWATLYGAGEQAWDDARLVVQIGGDAHDAMELAGRAGLFVVNGSTCRLGLLADRESRRGLGNEKEPALIDALHRALLLWKEENRAELVSYLAEHGLMDDVPFWKLAQALFETLPRDTQDWKLTSALLTERPTLLSEVRRTTAAERRLF
jgi:adenine-specific DNA methylase